MRNAQESVTTDEVSIPVSCASIRPLSRLAAGAGNQISGAPQRIHNVRARRKMRRARHGGG
ncbi:hypothetical protein KCP73_26345 [Salmonella enterica subsp. enterica]|nr:hypothetical protein KCP73_26345 [Salmonella enterica subsp. enterica]